MGTVFNRVTLRLNAVIIRCLSVRSSGPLLSVCHDYHPSRTLRSTSALLLQQQLATILLAARAFCVAAPTVWNSLGVHTRSADTFLSASLYVSKRGAY